MKFSSSPRILLGILVSNGDCLLATVVAKQIKKDYPGCHLTWAISQLCRPVIENNPCVDEIWEVIVSSKQSALKEDWHNFKKEAFKRKKNGIYDEIFFLQIYPDNVHFFDGTTRGTIYGGYPRKITVSAKPVVRLTDSEIENVKLYTEKLNLSQYKHVILFECSALSGQSFVTPEWALKVSEKLLQKFPNLFMILSTHIPLRCTSPRMKVANELTLRENAELTKYCTLLIGCSSGITWISTSDWAKPIPMIQFLKRGIGFSFASVAYDHKYWGLDISQIMETTESEIDKAVEIISCVLENGIQFGRRFFHKNLKPRLLSMLKYAFMYLRRGKIRKACFIVKNFWMRNYAS